MIKNGDIVFFKRVKKTLNPKHPEAAFPKGTGYGLFLGHVPLGQKEPPAYLVIRQLAQCGFVQLDDIQEILGKEVLETFTGKFLDKYYGKKIEEVDAEVKAKMAAIEAEREAGTMETPSYEVPEQKLVTRTLQLVDSKGIPVASETETVDAPADHDK